MTRSFLFFDDVADADPTVGGPSRPQDVQERMTREGREAAGSPNTWRKVQQVTQGFRSSQGARGGLVESRATGISYEGRKLDHSGSIFGVDDE